jgi:hypothetical protein
MTVWSLAFCELHGAEAEESAYDEIMEDTEMALESIIATEKDRFHSNDLLVRALEWTEIPGRGVGATRSRVNAIREAFPPVEGRIDPDILAYDYGDPSDDEPGGFDNPHDWWNDAHWLMTKAMRLAHNKGLAALLKDLELVRERAAAQVMQAEEDMVQRWIAPHLAAKGKSVETWRKEREAQENPSVQR